MKNQIVAAAVVVTAITSIGGGAIYLDNAHASQADFSKHLSEQRVRTVFGYMDQIKANGPQAWLCRALREELVHLCTELPEHAMCQNDADEKILKEAGC